MWGLAYGLAGDCVGLDDELSECVAHKDNMGYAAIAIGLAIFGTIAWVLQRRGRP
jgi:hypothetical protein